MRRGNTAEWMRLLIRHATWPKPCRKNVRPKNNAFPFENNVSLRDEENQKKNCRTKLTTSKSASTDVGEKKTKIERRRYINIMVCIYKHTKKNEMRWNIVYVFDANSPSTGHSLASSIQFSILSAHKSINRTHFYIGKKATKVAKIDWFFDFGIWKWANKKVSVLFLFASSFLRVYHGKKSSHFL